MIPGPWTVELFVAAFAGGVFGAAIGALPSFAFTGFLVVVGETYRVVRAGLGSEAAGLPDAGVVTGAIAFGPVLGPHVAFGGGAAAAAYAAREGYIDPEFDYHPAKYITAGVGTRVDVLLVGGAFGVVGHLVFAVSKTLAVPVDPVALGVVVSALAHRTVLGYSVVGRPTGGWFDMTPFEREETRTDAVATDGGTARLAVEPWLPHQYRWSGVALLGLAVGALGGYVAYLTASPFLAFGLSAASLVYINAGVDRIPVTHHVTLPASVAVLAAVPGAPSTAAAVAAALPAWQALAIGAAFGLLGALLGELSQRVLYAHAETHLDPPAASIVCSTLVVGALVLASVFPHTAVVPLP
jgi:MFS family permease